MERDRRDQVPERHRLLLPAARIRHCSVDHGNVRGCDAGLDDRAVVERCVGECVRQLLNAATRVVERPPVGCEAVVFQVIAAEIQRQDLSRDSFQELLQVLALKPLIRPIGGDVGGIGMPDLRGVRSAHDLVQPPAVQMHEPIPVGRQGHPAEGLGQQVPSERQPAEEAVLESHGAQQVLELERILEVLAEHVDPALLDVPVHGQPGQPQDLFEQLAIVGVKAVCTKIEIEAVVIQCAGQAADHGLLFQHENRMAMLAHSLREAQPGHAAAQNDEIKAPHRALA